MVSRRRPVQVKTLGDPGALRDHLAACGVSLPVDDDVDPTGPLAAPVTFTDGGAGALTAPNRFAVLPMEGWDATTDGRPTDLVTRRWQRFATSGCGLVWGEATAVVPEGRANPNQLVIDPSTVGDLATLRAVLDDTQVAGLQLTHSGRYARPHGKRAPRTVHANPVLDRRTGTDATAQLTDGEIDDLIGTFVAAAVLAEDAGFDFVDVKACHGYLSHEFLSAHDRPGPYGGDLAGRTRFLRSVIAGIRAEAPSLAVAVRLSLFDLVPFTAGDDGVGVPDHEGPYPWAFGGDDTGLAVDLTETHALLDLLTDAGVGLLAATCGSPYTVPHAQRPAYFPPSDGYSPPEDPVIGVARLFEATRAVRRRHDLIVIGSGLSYLQQWLPEVAQAAVRTGSMDMVGLGRMILSYPHLAADVLAGRPLEKRLICRTFSDCTTAPRGGLVSGCYPLDPFYKERPERARLVELKAEAKRRTRRR